MFKIREPIAAGKFYDLEKEKILKILEKAKERNKNGEKAFGCIVPHSNLSFIKDFVYPCFSSLDSENFLILAPDHFNFELKFSIMKEGLFKTPLGEAIINEQISNKILESCSFIENDFISHQKEYSVEILIIFLQHIFKNFKIVPILIGQEILKNDVFNIYKKFSEKIFEAIKDEDINIIITSNFPLNFNLDKILDLNEYEFFDECIKTNNFCGFGPTLIGINLIKKFKGKKCKLIKSFIGEDGLYAAFKIFR